MFYCVFVFVFLLQIVIATPGRLIDVLGIVAFVILAV